MWEFDYKESWALKNWCFWTMVLEKTLESPLDCKEIQPVHPKGNQSWIFIGRTDAEAETTILGPPDVKNWVIGKDWCWEGLKAGGEGDDRGWDGWMASPAQWTWVWVKLQECGDGQGSLVCYSPRGCKESDTTEWLNWTELREHFPWEKGPGCTILIPTDPGRLLRGNESSWQCREHRRCGLDLWVGKILGRRKWQPTSVFLPAKFRGQRNLASYSRWICKWVGQNVVTESAHTGRDRGLRETLEAGIHPLRFSYRWGFPRDGDSKELKNKAKENQNTAQEGKKIRSNHLPESEKPKLPNQYFIC